MTTRKSMFLNTKSFLLRSNNLCLSLITLVILMVKITQNDVVLGKRIRKARNLKDLTQEELAEKVKVSTTHIGLVETGKRRISLKTLQKIASALKIKAKDILPF